MAKSTLYVLSEDKVGIEGYLNKNGLYPTHLFFRTAELIEHLAFANVDMSILVIIHSLSRFTMGELNRLLDELAVAVRARANVVIMSDIVIRNPILNDSGITFIHYEGDLFFGTYTWYENNKAKKDTKQEDAQIADALNGRIKTTDILTKNMRQAFWDGYAEFTKPKKAIIGKAPKLVESKLVDSDVPYIDKLIKIDLGIGDT